MSIQHAKAVLAVALAVATGAFATASVAEAKQKSSGSFAAKSRLGANVNNIYSRDLDRLPVGSVISSGDSQYRFRGIERWKARAFQPARDRCSCAGFGCAAVLLPNRCAANKRRPLAPGGRLLSLRLDAREALSLEPFACSSDGKRRVQRFWETQT